ncbi:MULTISPECIES: RDD family protein [Aeromicrobium]|uniref:RDD family protein n=1 Tax=Aeromicrobium TaxID=2040 RepID=UPI0007006D07|nr:MULTISPECIES: RDD family protein [Aeromicrobium]KQX74410.1 hypothetical protein ASD10_03995 [Aeromicrobium sp. Root472D3]MBD8608639.1 RDD family protein [Aeromicrobium sp. CFBP 8757]MCL8250075.1 RDD family protein [Aeromicrobium fastidiosum]
MSASAPPPYGTPNRPYASWIARVGALIIDSLPTGIVFTVLAAAFGESQTSENGFAFQLSGLPFLVYVVFAIGWFVFNWVIRQGSTGQTIGKKIVGITVLGESTHQPIGGGLTFARQLVHVLDGLPCGLGYLWPLWDRENRTFADMIMSTRVFKA